MTFIRCACSSCETYRVSFEDPRYVVIQCTACGIRIWTKREQRCAYADQTQTIAEGTAVPNAVACSGTGTEVQHDKRGCVPVCAAHAAWRSRMSQIPGHSRDCSIKVQGDLVGS